MREVIFKYELNVGPNETIIPYGSRVVCFAEDPKDGGLKAWLSHARPEDGCQMVQRKFYVCATGEAYDSDQWTHLGTAVHSSGFVWHLLGEVMTATPKAKASADWSAHANQQ